MNNDNIYGFFFEYFLIYFYANGEVHDSFRKVEMLHTNVHTPPAATEHGDM